MGSIQGGTMILGVPGNRGAFLFPRRAHLLTTCKTGGGIPPLRSGSCALHELSFSHFSRGGRQCRRRTFPVQSALCFAQSAKRCGCILPPYPAVCLRKPATGSFIAAIGMSCFPTHLFSLLKKRNRKMKGR